MDANIPILYYHFVGYPPSNARIKGLYTSKKQFEWQVKQLVNHKFNFLTFEDIATNRFDTTKRNIVLTFDDGCESVYLNAFPILKKYNAKAVLYVVADSIGERNIVWSQNENLVPLNIVTTEQIVEMSNNGIEIGSHLCNHVHLTGLTSEEVHSELFDSKSKLENILNKPVLSVAYPFGSYTSAIAAIASEVGYKYGVVTKQGDNSMASNLELYRFGVKGYAIRHYWRFYKLLKKSILIL